MLESLQIKNFRSLQDVEIPQLGLVNLIVGNNNSGKSSLIEALLIYANSGDENLLNELAQAHGEPLLYERDDEESLSTFAPFESFFFNRTFPTDDNVKIQIGALGNDFLSIEQCFEKELMVKIDDEEDRGIRRIVYEPISKAELDSLSMIKPIGFSRDSEVSEQIRTVLRIERNGAYKRIFLDDFRRRSTYRSFDAKYNTPYSYIPTSFLNTDELALDWDKLVLTPYQDHIIEALRIIEPLVENISFVKSSNRRRTRFGNRIEEVSERTPIVKLQNQSKPFPLSSMGDGMLRILQLILKLHSSRDGMLLVDEFDNGLHHSVQKKVWELVFTLAKNLNIQVFATTHSYDCVKAFSVVARDKTDIEGILIQMGKSIRKSNFGKVIPSILNEEELATFIKSQLEVR